MKQRTPSPVAASPSKRPVWQGFAFAGLMLAAALLGRWLLDPYTRDAIPLATMYVAVAFAVWFGGWKPAAALAVVGYVAALWWFLPPRYSFKLWEAFGVLRTLLYFVSCSITIYLCESLRRVEQRQAIAEAKAVSILENMRDCFCSVDPAWQITQVNHSAERALGITRELLRTRTIWQVFPAAVGSPAESQLRRAMSDGVEIHFETNAFIPGAWHAVTAIPAEARLSIYFQDITLQRTHVDQLERLVDDRTSSLHRLISELEVFSYTLVHDIRAPLRAISGFAKVLADDHMHQLDAAGKSHIACIRHSAGRMDQLITDILAYSQLSRTKPELHPTDLGEIVREMLRSDPEFRHEKADIVIDGVLPTVRGNEVLLTQCFSNLLHNATKFVVPGTKPRIRIEAETNAALTRVSITDNGIGIPPEATARIFEPFRRENPNYDGTGIGLAIVQKVVEQLEGRVGVESQVGHGSRFWVELKVEEVTSIEPVERSATRVLV